MKTAIVIGATGLTGQSITRHLLDAKGYARVTLFSRRRIGFSHPKLTENIVDFDRIDGWKELLVGNDLFSALGSTKKQAGSKEKQYNVDYIYQANVIKSAAENGVKRLFLVSSPNASASSPFFYLRMKGELEEFAKAQNFNSCLFFRPSLITGDRQDNRIAEKLAANISRYVEKFIDNKSKYRPISGQLLGRAIVNCANSPLKEGLTIVELGEIFKYV